MNAGEIRSPLNGKRVVVVGASSGIGLAVSRLAHAEGAHVVMVSRSPDRLEEARSCDPVHDDKHVPDRHRTAGGRRPRHRHVNGVRRVVGITRRYTPTHRFTVVARSTANFYRASSDRFLALRG